MRLSLISTQNKDKDKDNMKAGYCQVASTQNLHVMAYIISYIHNIHTYIPIHKVNLYIQSPKYHKTLSLNISVSKFKF